MKDTNIDTNPTVEPDLTALQDEKCVPLALEFLKVLAEANGKVGSTGKVEELSASWGDAAKKMLELYLEKNLTIIQTNYVFKCTIQALEFTQRLIGDSLNESLTNLQKKTFDSPRLDEVPLKKIDEILKG